MEKRYKKLKATWSTAILLDNSFAPSRVFQSALATQQPEALVDISSIKSATSLRFKAEERPPRKGVFTPHKYREK